MNNYEARILELENKIVQIEKANEEYRNSIKELRTGMDNCWDILRMSDKRVIILEKHDEIHKSMFEHIKAMVDHHADRILQLFDVYYYVFPERAAQVARASKQLDKILGKPKAGGGDKSS